MCNHIEGSDSRGVCCFAACRGDKSALDRKKLEVITPDASRCVAKFYASVAGDKSDKATNAKDC